MAERKIVKLSEVRKDKEDADLEKSIRALPNELLAMVIRVASDEINKRLEET